MKHNEQNKKSKILATKKFAYKSIFVSDGLILLFEDVKPFNKENVKINFYNGDLFFEMGDNVALITGEILKHLIQTKHLFLYKSQLMAYQAEEQVNAFELNSDILAKIQGGWEVAEKMAAEYN